MEKRTIALVAAGAVVAAGAAAAVFYVDALRAGPPVRQTRASLVLAQREHERAAHDNRRAAAVRARHGAADCANGKRDHDESDVDCGGGTCRDCDSGRACKESADCASGACVAGACAPWARDVAAGPGFTCALTTAGGAKCWGANEGGQLGDGTHRSRTRPVDVSGLTTGVAALAVGGPIDTDAGFACALTTTGGVKCWGTNANGELGDGTRGGDALIPVDVPGLSSGVVAIAAGARHACAVMKAGTVKCWGENAAGELGDGTTTLRASPVDVAGMSNAATVSAGTSSTCVLTTAGGVKCWGTNASGKVGDGSDAKQRATPVDVRGVTSDAVALSVGTQHACAVMRGGALKCWGLNVDGALGVDGAKRGRAGAVDVSAFPSGATAVSAGHLSTCALAAGGAAQCWGHGGDYELGDGVNDQSTQPVDVLGLGAGVTRISANKWHACAVTGAGGVSCWGTSARGQLGDGKATHHSAPVTVVLP